MTLAEQEPAAARITGTGSSQIEVPGASQLEDASTRDAHSSTAGHWEVTVSVTAHSVTRTVLHGQRTAGSLPWGDAGKAIWPTWPASLAEERQASVSPLAELQRRWDANITRLRDSAKWIATALGAALAAVIPAASVSSLSERHLSGWATARGISGLFLIGVTLILVLQVLQPQSLSYADIQEASGGHSWTSGGAVCRWKDVVREHADIYLPCGVPSLIGLRQLLVVEEVTLMALADARERAYGDRDLSDTAEAAYTARVARLHELRAAAASIVAMGNFYVVKTRSNWSTYGGAVCGLVGLTLILSAVIGSAR